MSELLPSSAIDMMHDLGFRASETNPLKGDLSARRYFRLAKEGRTAILMLAPEADSGLIDRVTDTTARLAEVGVSVPTVLGSSASDGVAIVEDFGDLHLADLLRSGEPAEPLLSTVVDTLERVRLADTSGLPAPDATGFLAWLDVLDKWLPGADPQALTDLRLALEVHLGKIMGRQAYFSLRDCHCENVIWLDGREGVGKAGLIDFQDAFAVHPIYDVASLLRDARIDIAEDTVATMLRRAANSTGLEQEEARFSFDVFTIHRNLRIAAIFHRSAAQDGKSAHIAHMPRVIRHIERASRHPILDDLRPCLAHILPSLVTEQ